MAMNIKGGSGVFLEIKTAVLSPFVIDMQSTDMILVVAKSFFMMEAKIQFHPTMVLDDLKKGASKRAGMHQIGDSLYYDPFLIRH